MEKKDNLSVNQMQKELDILLKKKIQGKGFLRLTRKSVIFFHENLSLEKYHTVM